VGVYVDRYQCKSVFLMLVEEALLLPVQRLVSSKINGLYLKLCFLRRTKLDGFLWGLTSSLIIQFLRSQRKPILGKFVQRVAAQLHA
jgi:hypothetical protein